MKTFSPLFIAEVLLKLFFVFDRIRTVIQSQSNHKSLNLLSSDFRKTGTLPRINNNQHLSDNLEHICLYINQMFCSFVSLFPSDFVVKSTSLILMLSHSSLKSSQKFFYSMLFEKIKMRDSEIEEEGLMDLVRFVFTLQDLFEIQFREGLSKYEDTEGNGVVQNSLKVS